MKYFLSPPPPPSPQVALRIIVPKIRSENEKVAMLSLAVGFDCRSDYYRDSDLYIINLPGLVAGSLCEKLWTKVPSGAGKIQIPQ